MADIGRAGWIAAETKDNATTTATKTGVTGKQHIVYGISASFSSASVVKLVTIKDGTTIIWRGYTVGSQLSVNFPAGIVITKDAAVSGEVAASGAGGTIGVVNIHGITR